MKLSADQRKLLETVPLSVLTDVAKRRRAIEKLERRIVQGKSAVESWKCKIEDANAQLKTLRKLDLES